MRRKGVWASGLAGVLLLGAVPAFGADGEPSGWLELDAGPAGQVHHLTPGGSADWAIGIRAPGEAAGTLEIWLEPGANDDAGLRKYLSVELRACDQPWSGGMCPGGHRSLLAPTELNRAEGLRMNLMEPGWAVTRGQYVLVTAWLAKDVPQEMRGSRMKIVVGVRGSGDGASGDGASGSVPAQPTGPPSSILAETGARLGGFALLGFLAVAAGFGLSRLRGAGP
ncbi:hypothetical protein FQP90_19600 [Paenarthrobacter nitroguajacolicus]|uniref:Cell wall protein n=1 Tax=Paenarthrobacter nitroguajacolicus TaxID=211146 RepID=A0A558GQY9_PAENT|nr:hypothetical protein [Paenarthrobacter nitroguajacolicus]TVU59302.1 hypothetical protein FQP90_19600 [Paenarthrobacter nitroguajacolicus]